MKIIKNIFIGLGVLFLIFIIVASFATMKSKKFKEENMGHVTEFLERFSQDWELSSVTDQLSSNLISEIQRPNGQQAMQFFRTLGQLENVRDFEMGNFRASTTDGNVGTLVFKAKFNRADTLVRITLQEMDGVKKIHGINIDTLENIDLSKLEDKTST